MQNAARGRRDADRWRSAALVRTLARVLLAAGVGTTLQAHLLAVAAGEGDALGRDGLRGSFAIRFGDDLVAHEGSVGFCWKKEPAIIPHPAAGPSPASPRPLARLRGRWRKRPSAGSRRWALPSPASRRRRRCRAGRAACLARPVPRKRHRPPC